MADTFFPVDWVATGDNPAADGFVLGLYLIPVADIHVEGIGFESPAAQTLAGARSYAIGGSGGGDGLPMWTATDVDVVEGVNKIPFDGPTLLHAGQRYLFVVALEAGGRFKSVDNGNVELSGGVFTSVNGYWGVRSTDPTSVLPDDAVMSVSLEEPPWTQALRFYGVTIYYDSPPSQIVMTKNRVDDDHVSIDWTNPGDAPDGVSILRGPLAHYGDDPGGHAPTDPDYDPTGFPGVVGVADGLTDGPYVDTLPSPGVYTYWVVRTDPV